MKTTIVLFIAASTLLAAPVPKDFSKDPYLGEWELLVASERGIVHQDPYPVKLVVTATTISWKQMDPAVDNPSASWEVKRKPNSRTTLGHLEATLRGDFLILNLDDKSLLCTFRRIKK